MKKLVFSSLVLSFIGVLAVNGQTNAPATAPATPTTLTPPPDTAPVTTSSTTTTTTVTTPASAPKPTSAPVVTAPAPAHVAPHPAPPAQVVTIPAQPKRHASRPYHLTPVSWIVATRNQLHDDDRYVTIIGHVTRRIGDDEYWFADGTGSVRLDSENFDLPVGRRIVIGGRIDQAWLGFGHLEVDVRRWRYAN